jgi:DNA repair exonuclease SbcCD nuclease subunit
MTNVIDRILFIGDPHFRVDNLVESQKFIAEVDRILNEHPIDVVVVLGDVLHTHEKLHTFALNAAVQFFQMLTSKKPVYCLIGNHDATSNTIFLSNNHWMNVFKPWTNITIVETPILCTWSSKHVILCPYVPDGRFKEALEQTPLTHTINHWSKANLIVGHQLVDGAKMGPIVSTGVEEWRIEWPMLISGHIHDKQRPQENVFYTGSSMQHAFGESIDKTLYLYTLSSLMGQEIKLHIPRKEILYVNVADIDTIEEKVNQLAADDVSVKIVVRGNTSEMKAMKDTDVVKKLEQTMGVKSVVFKPAKPALPIDSTSVTPILHSICDEQAFELVLRSIVQAKGDCYLESLFQHLLTGGEDLSDKDVFFI